MTNETEKLRQQSALPEAPKIVEAGQEIAKEQPIELPAEIIKEAAGEEIAPVSQPVAATSVVSTLPAKDSETIAIENILSNDLEKTYAAMPPELRKKFAKKGDEVVSKIRVMIAKAAVKAKTVLRLIRDWLKIIPGVNRFFLEQEAKIKTDKILEYAEKNKIEE